MEVLLLKEAKAFYYSLTPAAQKKIANTIARVIGGEKNAEIFKKLDGSDIWELRAQYEGNAFRLFAFWDTRKRALIVATHGIVKKTQKTPRKEIAKAERIRSNYLTENENV